MKLSKEIIQELCKLLKAGNFAKDAVVYCGASEPTYYRWKQEAKALIESNKEIKEYTEYEVLLQEFQESIEKAEKEAIIRNVALIQKAASRQWQAAAWYLERRNYNDWGRKDRIEQTIINKDKIINKIREVAQDG